MSMTGCMMCKDRCTHGVYTEMYVSCPCMSARLHGVHAGMHDVQALRMHDVRRGSPAMKSQNSQESVWSGIGTGHTERTCKHMHSCIHFVHILRPTSLQSCTSCIHTIHTNTSCIHGCTACNHECTPCIHACTPCMTMCQVRSVQTLPYLIPVYSSNA